MDDYSSMTQNKSENPTDGCPSILKVERKNGKLVWNDSLRQHIINLFNSNLYTMEQIGEMYGTSRNAIAGAVNRARREGTIQVEVKAPPRHRLNLITDRKLVTLVQLKISQCKYPIGDPRFSDFRFCGRKRIDDKCPYCRKHAKLCYRPR